MHWLDWLVLVLYMIGMAGIGLWAMRRVKVQEDYFMGGRGFGKILQTFAAFGAGTGAADPVNTARTTVTSGMSGMWSIMSWLFATPFYWITGVWYRRMRHMTLGDWFVERYESKPLGAAYTVFGIIFYMFYLSMFFSAVGKVAAPLMGDTIGGVGLEYVMVPIISIVVIAYGVLGGLTAAYWTDLIQGIFIILLSILLIPFGLSELSAQFGDGSLSGFQIMHQRLDDSMFSIIGSTRASQFPWYMIAAVAIISLVGVAVQPHFIATGGGSAKSEFDARVGLVTGNFFKRFCTIGWALTALIVVALYAGTEHLDDPDKAWGVASRELLGPGLRGLMLACLLAALMSSADCYMLVSSALVVRNIYTPFVNPKATEAQCIRLGRLTGMIVIIGAAIVSLTLMNVFQQLQLTWVIPMALAPPFWIAMVWRRATTAAAWGTMAYVGLVFFVIPWLVPLLAPGFRDSQNYAFHNDTVVTVSTRKATAVDVRVRERDIAQWKELPARIAKATDPLEVGRLQAALDTLKAKYPGSIEPPPLTTDDTVIDTVTSGGISVFWTGKLTPIDASGNPMSAVAPVAVKRVALDADTIQITKRYAPSVRFRGSGQFQLDYLLFHWLGMDLRTKSTAQIKSLQLFSRLVAPFLVMILLSLVTKRNSKAGLDRYYVKMKTPVDPDRLIDEKQLAKSYEHPDRFDHLKLFPGSDLEVLRPRPVDVIGFVLSVIGCFVIVGIAMWVASIGS